MKKLIGIGVALVLALVAGAALTRTPAPQVMATLPIVEEAALEATLTESTIPVGVFVSGPKCESCASSESILAGAAAKHPGMKFIKVLDDERSEPGFLVVVPGLGPSYQLEKFNESARSVDSFIAKRVKVAGEEQAIANKIVELKGKIDELAAPFNEKLAEIQKNAGAAVVPHQKELARLSAEAAAAAKPYAEEAAALTAKLEEAEKPFKAESEKLQAEVQAAMKPYAEQSAQIEKSIGPEVKELLAQLQAAQKAGDKEKFMALQAQVRQAFGPNFEKMQTLMQEMQNTVRPFQAKGNKLEKQLEAATAVLRIQLDTAMLNGKAATMGFEQPISDARKAAEAAAAPFKAQAAPIAAARQAAVGTLAAELQQLAAQLESMVLADQPQ